MAKTLPLTVLAWNVYTGHAPGAVLAKVDMLTKRHDPAIVYLSEAAHCHTVLHRVPGYRLIQLAPKQARGRVDIAEDADSALLVRRDVKVIRTWTIRMTREWVGPKHELRHSPRVYLAAVIGLPDGGRWRISGQHWPTKNQANAAAVAETIMHARRFLATGVPFRPRIIVGDLNAERGELADHFDARAIIGSQGPDHALAHNAHGTEKVLPKYGSDHHARLYTIRRGSHA